MITLLMPLAAEAACPNIWKEAEIDQSFADAEAALAAVDIAAFGRARDESMTRLLCASQPLSPTVASRAHRVEGLYLLGSPGKAEAGKASLRAARIVDPSYTFPDTLLAPGDGTRAAYEAIAPTEGATVAVGVPDGGRVVWDGRDGAARPTERPAILQLVDANGAVTTWYLRPEDALPKEIPEPQAVTDPPATAKKSPVGLVAAGVGVVALGVAGASQWDIYRTYQKNAPTHLDADMHAWYEAENVKALQAVNAAMAVAGVGLVAGGAAVTFTAAPEGAHITIATRW